MLSIFKKKKTKADGDVAIKPGPIKDNVEKKKDKEIAAVIGIALYLYSSKLREYEETVITIQRFIKPYSPWNSKLYNLRQVPQRQTKWKPIARQKQP